MKLLTNQEDITTPFIFETNKAVYSLEEAIYYVYTTKKEKPSLVIDYLTSVFIEWVRNVLNQPFLAEKLENIKEFKEFEKLKTFLSIVPLIDDKELFSFIKVSESWSETNKNKILNNTAIKYAIDGNLDEALAMFEEALEKDSENKSIMINIASVYIAKEEYEEAFKCLNKAENGTENADADFFYGQIARAKGNFETAIDYLENAISLKYEKTYIYELSKIYVETRRYKHALSAINSIKEKDDEFFREKAFIYSHTDLPSAILEMNKAINLNESCENFTLLAKYHRENRDLDNARVAILKALGFDKTNMEAQIEEAKIRKALGDLDKYQKTMLNVLNKAKEDYRVNLFGENTENETV